MSDEPMKLTSAEFEQEFFAGAGKVTLEIELLKETYADLQAAIERNGWQPEEGPLIVLTLGLGYLQGQRLLAADDETLASLANRLTNMESQLAVMKFRTYSFMQDNQTLEMRMGALRNSANGLEHVVRRLQPERDALKAEVERLQAELVICQERLLALEAGLPEPSWCDKLVSFFKKMGRRRRDD